MSYQSQPLDLRDLTVHKFPRPKKTLINARHVAPSEVMSRRLVKSHLEKRNDRTTKGAQPSPIIKDSSDISNTSVLEPGGQVYRYWARPGPTCLPDSQSSLTERLISQYLQKSGRTAGRPRPSYTWPTDEWPRPLYTWPTDEWPRPPYTWPTDEWPRPLHTWPTDEWPKPLET